MEDVLLCTHDPILVKSLYGILRDKGYDVEIADHLALAVQMVLKSRYYAVIIDDKSFGLSAEDAVQIIRRVSPDMLIIVAGEPACRTDALTIRTPVDLEEFSDVLNAIHQGNKTHITKEERKWL